MADKISKLLYLAGATRFKRISEKLFVDGDKVYSQFNINFKASWFSVYYTLINSDKPLTVQELSAEIGFTHITVKNVVRELEVAGLARIKANPNDGRSKLISLTTKGNNLYEKLEPIWKLFASSLENMLTEGHPDCINILNRIDAEVERLPLSERMKTIDAHIPLYVVDYKPSLKSAFYDLAGNWLLGMLNGKLEKEDAQAFKEPERTYLDAGGFILFAIHNNKPVGCVALKRLSENSFEFCKLYVDPEARKLGIATKLIERCITRCNENRVTTLYLQSTNALKPAHQLYYKLGFEDCKAPKEMDVLVRTEKIMSLQLR